MATMTPGRGTDEPPPDLPTPGAETVLDSLTEVVFRTDPAGNWTYLNAAWTVLTGFPIAATLGTNFLDYVHPDEREHTVALFMAVVAGGGRYCHHQTRYRTADGQYRWIDLRATLLVDDEGQPIGNAGTIIDITQDRLALERVTEHAQVLEVVAEGSGLDELPIAVATYGSDLTLIRVSPLLERMLGTPMRVGDNVTHLLRLLEISDTRDGRLTGQWGMIATALRTGRPQHSDLHLVRPDEGRGVSLQASVIPLDGAGPAHFALILHDVTQVRRAERQQAGLAELGQRSVAGEAVPALFEAAVAVVTEVLETPLCEMFELSAVGDVLLPRAASGWPDGPRDLSAVPTHSADSLLTRTLTADGPVVVRDLKDGTLVAEQWLIDKGAVSGLAVTVNGPEEPCGVLATQMLNPRRFTADEIGFLEGVANVLATSVQRARSEEAMRHQTLHDPLTGLANRVLLHDHLSLALRSARREGHRVALLLMDLDRFKEINDTLGHDVGDDVLRLIAARLRHALRDSDTVARLGGDEFAVVLPVVADVAAAVTVATKMAALVEDQIELDGVSMRVEASIGIATSPEDGEDAVQLLKQADVAMYRAKALSIGVAVYSPGADQNRPERLEYLAALRRGITGDELVMLYQPMIDLATGATAAAEALVRWRHPSDGQIPPDMFIPLAEQTGLIKPLTWRVIDLSLGQARQWRQSGLDLTVAVNVSARMLHQSDLVRYIVGALQRNGLPPDSLTVEITESGMMANPSSALAVITRLRAEGVRISVDDFGTGRSSLAYLRHLPVNEIKIDRSFVQDVTKDGKYVSIVRAIIDLGHTLSLRVVAEGIEDSATCELLRSLHCDHGQGFYLGRPGPAEEVIARSAR